MCSIERDVIIYSNARPSCSNCGETIWVELKAINLREETKVVAELVLTPHAAEALVRKVIIALDELHSNLDKATVPFDQAAPRTNAQ